MTARKSTAPAQPVANLAEAKKAQTAMRQAQAQTRQRHPAGKTLPQNAAKPATKKAAKATPATAQKRVFEAVGRGGVRRTATSTGALVAAVDVKITGKKSAKSAAFANGVIVAFYASKEKAQKAADAINAGEAGKDWQSALVVKVTPVTEAVSA